MQETIYFLLPNLSYGGQERVATTLSYSFSKEYLVKFLLFQPKIAYPYKGLVEVVNSPPQKTFIGKFKELTKRVFYLRQLLKKETPKAVISFGESANLVNLLTPKKESKTIISIRQDFLQNLDIDSFYKSLYLQTYFFLYRKADYIVTVSKKIEYNLIKAFKIPHWKVKTIYNPIEVEEIQEKAKESLGGYEIIKDFPYLITVGRLTKQKGQWYLLRIFKHLKTRYKDLKLLILGEGKLKNYLVELSQNLGLKTYVWNRDMLNKAYDVYFLGFQENPYKFIKHAKLFIFTSLWEGLPNVLIESLAVGKTIISTDCRTGPREILAPNTDFLYQTSSPSVEEFGILMPTFEEKLLKANDPLTEKEKVWINTLSEVLNDEKLLKKYELKAPNRAYDFHIDKITNLWLEVI